MRVVGLMSGTSLDGIDAALVEIADPAEDGGAPGWRLLSFITVPFDAERRQDIRTVLRGAGVADVARLHVDLGHGFADAALAACDAAGVAPAGVDLIGSHGQTVWHEPDRAPGVTLQLGDPATIAERTGVPVISDFRSRDVATGGQGAPLVPWVDRLLFAGPEPRALVNIGGMANVTRVPARGADEPLVAFDTGPGNAILNAAVERATGGAATHDVDGERARRGRVDAALLADLLADPYFERPPPKSTGRERFGGPYVDALLDGRPMPDDGAWADFVATLTELVARSIAGAIRTWCDPVSEVAVTGGGGENPALMDRLEAALRPIRLAAGSSLGVDPAAKEAVAFAFLAWAHHHGLAGNVPEVTGGASRVLGSRTPA